MSGATVTDSTDNVRGKGGVTEHRWALGALALGTFSISTTVYASLGLLPVIAAGVGVSIATAGALVTAYGLGVAVGAPLMTIVLGRARQKTALVVLMAIFTLGNVLAAVAPSYGFLMAARVLTSLSHGAFFGIGVVVAASLVPKDRQASAVATVVLGLTVANIGGVPLSTWVGQQVGWRSLFVGGVGLGVLTMAALLLALPRGEKHGTPDVRSELKALGRPAALVAFGITLLGTGATFTLYTYITPVLENLTGATPAFVTAMLVLIGIGFTVGAGVGGRLGDRWPNGTLIAALGAVVLVMLAFPLVAGSYVGVAVALLLWGTATYVAVPPIQTRVMRVASEAPGLASSVNFGAFNAANALGAVAGGVVISAGLGYAAVPIAGAALAGAGLVLVLLGTRRPKGVAG